MNTWAMLAPGRRCAGDVGERRSIISYASLWGADRKWGLEYSCRVVPYRREWIFHKINSSDVERMAIDTCTFFMLGLGKLRSFPTDLRKKSSLGTMKRTVKRKNHWVLKVLVFRKPRKIFKYFWHSQYD